MPFKKGQITNPGGRPKGSKDKKTEQWHRISEYLLNEGTARFQRILEEEDDNDFKKDFISILEFFKPKHIRQDQRIKFNGELPPIIINPVKKNGSS